MKSFFYKFDRNFLDSFGGYNLIYHFIAIVFTYVIVVSNFDWKYYLSFKDTTLYYFLFSAAAIGGLMPLLAPVAVWIYGKTKNKLKLLNTSYALAQAAILGSLISSLYKAFTGRLHPSLISHQIITTDISHIFQFGLFRGGIFWGWPSSHTTIAFAMAFTLWAMYPKNKIVKIFTFIYALYIGIGVSMTIHWFSDFIAGAFIGTAIGLVVGKAFLEKQFV